MNTLKVWKMVLLLVLVFLAGGVTGSVVTSFLGKRALARAFNFDLWPDGIVRALEERMTLSAGQKTKVQEIGEDLAKKMKNTLNNAIAESGRIIVDAQQQIDQVLTPEQRIIHAQMKEEFRTHLKEGLNVTLPPEKSPSEQSKPPSPSSADSPQQ